MPPLKGSSDRRQKELGPQEQRHGDDRRKKDLGPVDRRSVPDRRVTDEPLPATLHLDRRRRPEQRRPEVKEISILEWAKHRQAFGATASDSNSLTGSESSDEQ